MVNGAASIVQSVSEGKKWANISPEKMMIQWILPEIFFSLKCGPLLQSNSAFLAKFGKRGRGGGHLNN